jgi:pyruvate decarboxylase
LFFSVPQLKCQSFLLNNDGYTIERLIHGMEAPYNKVPIWDYGALFKAFGPAYNPKYYLVKTSSELEELLGDAAFNAADRPQVIPSTSMGL